MILILNKVGFVFVSLFDFQMQTQISILIKENQILKEHDEEMKDQQLKTNKANELRYRSQQSTINEQQEKIKILQQRVKAQESMTKKQEETNIYQQQLIDQNRKMNHEQNDKIDNNTQAIRDQQNLIISGQKVNK